MQDNQRLFSLILNVIAKDKEIDDRWRGFSRPVSSRNLANDVDDTTVDALAEAVTSRMPDIAHRYYQLKAGWMGADSMPWGTGMRLCLVMMTDVSPGPKPARL